MFQLDNALLIELGLGSMDDDVRNEFLNHIYETLEMRVGMILAAQMSDRQVDEFEGYIDRNDEEGALAWLATHFPRYKEVVHEQLDLLKQEVVENAEAILAAS